MNLILISFILKYYENFSCNSNILIYGGANTKAEYKCGVGYFHTTCEVDPGTFSVSRNPPIGLLLAGLEVSKEANYQIALPTLFFGNWSICRSQLLDLLTAVLPW